MTRIQFLISDASVEVALPDGFDELPSLRTAVAVEGELRQISFFPSPRFAHPSELDHLTLVGSVVAPEGDHVNIYEQREEPKSRMAVWDMPGGFINVAAEEGQGAQLETIVNNVRIDAARRGYPRVTYSKPFVREDHRFPARRDIAMFAGDAGDAGDGSLNCLTFECMPSRGARDSDDGSHDELTFLVHYGERVKVTLSGPKAQRETIQRKFQGVVDSMR
jgi:hypothetical protein